jgi:hypothetical protein
MNIIVNLLVSCVFSFGGQCHRPAKIFRIAARSRAIALCDNVNPIRSWNSDWTRRSGHPHHYSSQFKTFLPLNEHRTTGACRMRIAIGEPEVLIMRQQVAPKVSGQHVAPVSRVSCVDKWNVGALDLGMIEFQWSNVIEVILQYD